MGSTQANFAVRHLARTNNMDRIVAVQAPVLAAIGFMDTTLPPAGLWAALNPIPVAKEPRP